MPKQPEKPGDLMQNLKYLRFVDPNDSTKIVQLALVDSGTLAADGTRIFTLGVNTAGALPSPSLPSIAIHGSYQLPGIVAYQLAAQALVNGIVLKADSNNSGTIWVGGTAGVAVNSGFPLEAGESLPITINNVNKLFVIGTLNDRIHWIGG